MRKIVSLLGVTEWAGQIRLQHIIIVYSEFGKYGSDTGRMYFAQVFTTLIRWAP